MRDNSSAFQYMVYEGVDASREETANMLSSMINANLFLSHKEKWLWAAGTGEEESFTATQIIMSDKQTTWEWVIVDGYER